MPEMTPTSCDLPNRPGAMATIDVKAITSGLAEAGWPPLRVTKAVLNWMRYHFGAESRILSDYLKDRVWTDAESSPILIQSLAEYSPNVANKRPAVLVNRLQQTPEARTIDLRRIGGCGAGGAELQFQQNWAGQHMVYCVGGREGEAEELAGEVTGELFAFCRILRNPMCLTRLELAGALPRQKLEEYQETWSVPIGISYVYTLSSRVFPLDAAAVTQFNLTVPPPQ